MIYVLIIVYIYGVIGVILYVGMNTWKVPLVVDISIVKNWFEVYWIIKRIKYTLIYWLIKRYWTLSCLGSRIWILCGIENLRKGDFGT